MSIETSPVLGSLQVQHQKHPLELIRWIYFTARTELFRHFQLHAWTSSPEYPISTSNPTHPGMSLAFLQPPPRPSASPLVPPPLHVAHHQPSHPCWRPSSAHRQFLHPNPVNLCCTLSALTSSGAQVFIFSHLDYTSQRPPYHACSLTLHSTQLHDPAKSHSLPILQGLPFSIGYSRANSKTRLPALPPGLVIYCWDIL